MTGAVYRQGRLIGSGGMAEVYFGQAEGVDGFLLPVAIKRVRDAHATDPEFLTAFATEAKLAVRLSHPNIVRVIDFQQDARGVPFMVLEYVHGKDLCALSKTGALPCSTAVYVATEILRGLAYAHDLPTSVGVRGIVHRDISPHNILLSWHGEVKVSDFGIAKAFSTSILAHSTTIKGKPGYMSPEQINAEPLDGRSDLFSVGIVLWELLTGKPLFEGMTYHETLARVLRRRVPRPSEEAQTPIPPEVEDVVLRLLARDKNERYATAHDATADLLACQAAPRNGMKELADLLARRCQRSRSFTPMLGLPRPDGTGESPPQAMALTARAVAPLADHDARAPQPSDVLATGPHDQTMVPAAPISIALAPASPLALAPTELALSGQASSPPSPPRLLATAPAQPAAPRARASRRWLPGLALVAALLALATAAIVLRTSPTTRPADQPAAAPSATASPSPAPASAPPTPGTTLADVPSEQPPTPPARVPAGEPGRRKRARRSEPATPPASPTDPGRIVDVKLGSP